MLVDRYHIQRIITDRLNRFRAKEYSWPDYPTIHCCYHKCMTVLFTRVLSAVSHGFNVQLVPGIDVNSELKRRAIHIAPKSEMPLVGSEELRGSHIVRDPRDIVVSAYLYHLRTHEAWCRHPSPANDDLPADISYQDHLRSLSTEEGLFYEMTHVSDQIIGMMASWDYGDSRFIELRFEDVIGDEIETFKQVFLWYGLEKRAAEIAANMARPYTYEQIRNDSGAVNGNVSKHISGRWPVGVWKKYFTKDLKREFKDRFQGVLEMLDYERYSEW